MRVSELEGELLDFWVAKAMGIPVRKHRDGVLFTDEPHFRQWDPSSSWLLGGPIIERERIELLFYGTDGENLAGNPWEAQIGCNTHYIDQGPGDAIGGPTPLVAAMRAYVASKFGEEVPDEAIDAEGRK